jgi:hypothetical protein
MVVLSNSVELQYWGQGVLDNRLFHYRGRLVGLLELVDLLIVVLARVLLAVRVISLDEHGLYVVEILELGLDLFLAGYFVLLELV